MADYFKKYYGVKFQDSLLLYDYEESKNKAYFTI